MDDAEPADVVTWHHGLIARWWANFNLDGPEIEFFRPIVAAGQPALDVACGTGRLLVPWVADGLDVDGIDASADMIAACRAAADRVGRQPGLFVQPVHRLDLRRRYGAVVMCGGFGLGGTRDQDVEGLRRIYERLRPGGRLALDYEVGQVEDQLDRWRVSTAPSPVPGAAERRLGPDGFEYALAHRVVDTDLPARTMRRELEAWQWRDGELVAHEVHQLVVSLWRPAEIVEALEAVGFGGIEVVGGYDGGPPTGDERFLVYLARRPGLVPDDFDVPRHLVTAQFRLEPLGPEHNEADLAAWTSSIEHIRTTPGFPDGDWPPIEGMTLERNLADLARHAADFARGSGFTYTVRETGTDEVIGCVYLYPPEREGFDLDVRTWVRADRAELDGPLAAAVEDWLSKMWPFQAPDDHRGDGAR